MNPIIKQHIDNLNEEQLKEMLSKAEQEKHFRNKFNRDMLPSINKEINYINSKIQN